MLVGMEASGFSHWFEQLLAECGHQLWIGDAAQIRASYVWRQKTDRRDELLASLEQLQRQITALDEAVEQEAWRRPEVMRLRTQKGVGPVTGLATVLTLGPVKRFANARQVASYVGLTPREHSSGGKQRLGHISKQGSPFLRGLLVEAAQSAARHDPELRRCYLRLAMRKGKAVAKVAVARKLLVKMYWMLRQESDKAQLPGSSCR